MSDGNKSKGGGLWGRFFGLRESDPETPASPTEPPAPGNTETVQELPREKPFDGSIPPAIPMAQPISSAEMVEGSLPMAIPVFPLEKRIADSIADASLQVDAAASPKLPPCPVCQSDRLSETIFCNDCGYMFGLNDDAVELANSESTEKDGPGTFVLKNAPGSPLQVERVRNRYELVEELSYRKGVRRFRALDHETGNPVILVAQAFRLAPAEPVAIVDSEISDEEIMPGFDVDPEPSRESMSSTEFLLGGDSGKAEWPSLAWERSIVAKTKSPGLPALLDSFTEGEMEYLVEQVPQGRILWDAWDDPEADAAVRYGYARQIAEAMHDLHQAGAMIEGLQPDMVMVTDEGQAMLIHLGDLLPLHVPAIAPIKANLYTSPELILAPQDADARSVLYSFGAMLYSLEYLHHPLEEKDFEHQFVPIQITERFPDVHPLFLRLINKTFVRDLHLRFPTDEASRKDATGFHELIQTLRVCQKSFDNVRLDIAAWTTTGMVRTGNEDAFGVLHGVDAREDDVYEYALVCLCDGMGGYDAGEVAAALAIQELKTYLLQQPLLQGLAGKDMPSEVPSTASIQETLVAALKHTNRAVYTAARTPGKGKRGMGCTAEAVYIDNRRVVVGHVGDSRTYHLHKGRLVQLTTDQTLVHRLVELGQLTPKEAESHPRRNELQQAIGGQPDVNPGSNSGKLQRGDWVLVCSDGLSNHISNQELEKMLTREAAGSAEDAARRLVNLANLRGATDNSTIVVIRAV